MTFEQFKKSICDKDPQVKWALDLIDEEVKEALQQQREEIAKEILNEINKERDRIWSEIEEWCLDHDVERDDYLARIIFDKPVGDDK